jgi:hypothetical protein
MALVLKAHILGKNPWNIEPIWDSVRIFTNQRRISVIRNWLGAEFLLTPPVCTGCPWNLSKFRHRNSVASSENRTSSENGT